MHVKSGMAFLFSKHDFLAKVLAERVEAAALPSPMDKALEMINIFPLRENHCPLGRLLNPFPKPLLVGQLAFAGARASGETTVRALLESVKAFIDLDDLLHGLHESRLCPWWSSSFDFMN